MRHIRSRIRQVGLLTVPIVALSLTLGASEASALAAGPNQRPAGQAAPAGITWHGITAINGWHSGQARYGTGSPSWAVSGGVVYLSGSVIRSSGSSVLFGVLPSQARPSHKLWITVYTLDDTTGSLVIEPNGKMRAYSGTGNAAGYTSLAGVSFPARSLAQLKLKPVNGWHSSQSQWNSGDPSYAVSGGVVYLSGSVHRTTGTNTIFATLPKAARPASVEYITVYTFGGTFGVLVVKPDGTLQAYDGAASSFTSLAGVSYPAAKTARHPLTLRNGWVSEASVYHTGDPSSSLVGGVVYLSGSMATSGTKSAFAQLPAGSRPTHELFIKTYTFSGSVGTLDITPGGLMFAYSPTPADARDYTSLATISFPLKS